MTAEPFLTGRAFFVKKKAFRPFKTAQDHVITSKKPLIT
jgi:hypothetical protein